MFHQERRKRIDNVRRKSEGTEAEIVGLVAGFRNTTRAKALKGDSE